MNETEKREPMTSPAERVGMGEDEQRNERALEPATKRDDMELARTMTPEQLGGEIRLLTAQARRMALSYGIQIGYRLKLAHDKVGPHGWAEWLARETEFSAAAASRFEKLYEGYGEEQGSLLGVGNKFPTLEKISISNALRLLAVPEEEREEVAVELDAEHLSTRELEKALAERDEALRTAEEMKQKLARAVETADELTEDAERLEKERDEAKRRIKELESRPVEVAVERDETAIQEAAEAAKKAAEDAARAETEELRRKLIAAESGAGEAAIYCKAAQENMLAAVEKVRAMHETHPEAAEKLLAGLERILQGLGQRVAQVKEGWT